MLSYQDRQRSQVSRAIYKVDLVYILLPVQPIISAKQSPGSVHYLDSISLRYGFHRTEDAEVPLPALLEGCHQRLLGSLLIRCVGISTYRVLTAKRTSPSRRRYPLVFGTWKFVGNREISVIPSTQWWSHSVSHKSSKPSIRLRMPPSVWQGDRFTPTSRVYSEGIYR